MKKRTPKIVVKKGKSQNRVVVKAANNRTLAVTETFSSKGNANQAAVRLKKTIQKAKIVKKK